MTLQIERPRVVVGDEALFVAINKQPIPLGLYFLHTDTSRLMQWNQQWEVVAWGGQADPMRPIKAEEVVNPNDRAAAARSGEAPSAGYSPFSGGGIGGGGGISPAPVLPGDPSLTSAQPGGGLLYSGGKLANVGGVGGTGLPAAGTIIKLDIWNGIEIAGVDCTLSTAANQITVNKTGRWRVHSRFYTLRGAADEHEVIGYVFVNGAQRARTFQPVTASAGNVGASVEIDTVLALNSGDIIDIRGSTTNATGPVTPGQLQRDDMFEVNFEGA